jgi:hypothetical protein
MEEVKTIKGKILEDLKKRGLIPEGDVSAKTVKGLILAEMQKKGLLPADINKSMPTAFQSSAAPQTSTKPSPMLIYGIIGGLVLVYFLTKKKK